MGTATNFIAFTGVVTLSLVALTQSNFFNDAFGYLNFSGFHETLHLGRRLGDTATQTYRQKAGTQYKKRLKFDVPRHVDSLVFWFLPPDAWVRISYVDMRSSHVSMRRWRTRRF